MHKIPLYNSKISANFPTPADDDIDLQLDLNEHLITHPAATFMLRVEGNSMQDAGILPGDLLIVDKSLEPRHGKIVIAAINDELTVKTLYKKDNCIKLMPANKNYQPINVSAEQELIIWGVVTWVLHKTD